MTEPGEAAGPDRPADPTLLAVLLRERNWHRWGMFRVAYADAARQLDPIPESGTPSRAQWHRWMTGELSQLPRVDHCRVLEAMLPGWTAEQLLAPPDAQGVGADGPSPAPALPGHSDGHRSDVTSVFVSRSEFLAAMPPATLLDEASQIRACGLSLNVLCQQLADQRLRQPVEDGTCIHALFLQPYGQAIEEREREEGMQVGRLSALTQLNIDLLLRVRNDVAQDLQVNIQPGTYDETIRFNITLIDNDLCITQPYLPAMRGLDSPTLVMQRQDDQPSLFHTFEQVFSWVEERSTPL